MAPSGVSDTPEQPDTTSIRAEWYAGMNIMDAKDCIRALCDALDAARAERDEWKANTLASEALYLKHFNRAEAAEARIAKAVAAYRRGLAPGDTESAMYEALTEETP